MNEHANILVDQGNFKGGVEVYCCNGKAVYMGVQPDFITMLHELLGETLQYRAGHGNLRNDSALNNRTVIKAENEIRAFHNMNPRTGSGHGVSSITVDGKVK